MVSFPFTKNKFLSLPVKARYKWLIKWLSHIYKEIAANRLKLKSCILFFKTYSNVLQWMGEQPYPMPEKSETMAWIEFVSDSIHRHRMESGIFPKDYNLLPKINTGDKKPTAKFAGGKFPCFNYHIALDGLRSMFNTGSIFRTCDAGGFQSIILGNTYGPEHPAVQKTSMGTYKWIPCTKTDDLASTLGERKKQGLKITGIETVQGSENYMDYKWQEKGIIVFGNEEYGISSHVMRVCDDFVHIPMFGMKNSLNVANAVSIIVFHIVSILKID